MAQGNCREFFQGETVWVKKYFYVLRPLLAIQWIERDLGVVPMEFETLVDRLVTDGQLRADIDKLLAAKKAGMELGRGPKIPSISRFINQELDRWENPPWMELPNRESDDELNRLFRASFDEVWGQ